MAGNELEALYGRYASKGDIGALAEVFDRVAPDLARLGRMLVGDQHRAEDLVQETFLTATLQPATYDRSRPLKPWLVGILVNRARTARRAAGQEFEADRLTEREVATPDAEVTRQEHLAAVGAAVSELPAKLRTVVEARLAGKETSELARELGISQGALRVRLHRALQRMRAILPPGFATAFAIMFLHSQGLAQVRARVLKEAGKQKLVAGAGASAAAIGIGSALMTKKVLFAVSLVGLVLVGVGLNSAVSYVMADKEDAGDGGLAVLPTIDSGGSGGEARSDERVPDERTELANVTLEAPEADPVAAPTCSLSGVVLGLDDQPVAGIEVTAWDGTRFKGDPDHVVETNSRGEFTLPSLGLDFVVTAQSEKYACARGLRGKRSADSDATGLVILVDPAVRLSGVVVDPGGVPVEGAEITLETGLSSHSDRDLTDVSDVRTFVGGRMPNTETAADGSFELTGLPSGSQFVMAKKVPYLVHREHHRPADSPIRIQLETGLMIRGHVTDSRGLPAEGARVRMWPWWSNVQTVDRFVTVDASGDFLLTSAVMDQWSPISVGVIHEGHAIHIVEVTEFDESNTDLFVRIPLDASADPKTPKSGYVEGGENIFVRLLPEKFLAGHVVDTEGKPLPGVKLWIEGEREMKPGFTHVKRSTWEWAFDLEESETDEAGAFAFGRLYPGTYEIHAVSPEDKKLVTDLTVEAGDEEIRLVLDASKARKVVLKGQVTDRLTGEPITEFTVVPFLDSGIGFPQEVVDAEGRFEIAGLDEGEIEVKISAPGYAQATVADRLFTIGEHEFDAPLSAARSLKVSVVDSAGNQLGSGHLNVFDLAGEPVWVGPEDGPRSTHVYFNDGKAILHGLPAQPLTLEVQAEHKEIEVAVDMTQPIEGEFEVVIDPDPPIPTVRVDLMVLSGRGVEDVAALQRAWDARHDPNGTKFGDMPQDIYTLLATAHVEFRDEGGKLVAKAWMTPLDEGYEVYSETFEQLGIANKIPFPGASMDLPAKRLTLTAKAADHRDITRVLDLTGQPGEILEIVNLVRR